MKQINKSVPNQKPFNPADPLQRWDPYGLLTKFFDAVEKVKEQAYVAIVAVDREGPNNAPDVPLAYLRRFGTIKAVLHARPTIAGEI